MTTPPFPVLSVVIPAYNEEPRIAASVAAIDAFLESRPYPSEVIVVDDGSRDGTPRVLADLQKGHPRLTVLRNEPNRGKGGSVKRGVLAARGDYVLFTDADLPIPIEEVEALIDTTRKAMEAGIAAAVPGAHIEDISAAVEDVATPHGFGIVRQFVGHGIGTEMHEEPQVPNYRTGRRGRKLEPGLCLAIEPMFTLGDYRARILADDWTVSTVDGSLAAHFEDTIAITDDGPMVLTAL